MLLPTGIIAYAAVNAWLEHPTDDQAAVGSVVVALCLGAAMRWTVFAGAKRVGEDLVVLAMFGSRRIPLDRIQRVYSGYAYLTWKSRGGRTRLTWLTPFWSNPNPLESVTKYNNSQLRIIRSWAAESREGTSIDVAS
jgi:hypothetical protein